MTAPDFASLLAASGFTPAPQLAAATSAPAEPARSQPLKIPHTHHRAQKQLIQQAESELHVTLHKPDAATKKELNAAVDKLYKSIPGALPQVHDLPPKPKIVVYDDGEFNATSYLTDKGDASIIAVSSQLLASFTPSEQKAFLAHELSHLAGKMNSGMADAYLPEKLPATVSNFPSVKADLAKQGIPFDKDSARYIQYMAEMAADDAVVRMTGDAGSYISALKKFQNHREELFVAGVKKSIGENELSKMMPEELQKRITSARVARDAFESQFNPHPSDEVRYEAIKLLAQKLATGKNVDHIDAPLPAPKPQMQSPQQQR